MRLLVAAVLVIAFGVAHGAETGDSTLEHLEQANVFAFGRVGRAGVISEGELGYKAILARPSAVADFEKVLATGNPQAKSYAPTGIAHLNPGQFDAVAQPFRNSAEHVTTQIGCIVGSKTLGSVVRSIDARLQPKLQQP